MTVVIEHGRIINRILKEDYGLTSTELCILYVLQTSDYKAIRVDLAEYFHLKKNSVSADLASLAEKGYVKKTADPDDRRRISLSETAEGNRILHEAIDGILSFMQETLWLHFSQDDLKKIMDDATTVYRNTLPDGLPYVESLLGSEFPVTAEFIICTKLVPKTWESTIKENSSLSMSEFRILSLLVETGKPLRIKDIANSLFLDQSAVSVFKQGLLTKGFVTAEIDAADSRSQCLVYTDAGKETSNRIMTMLTGAMADMFGELDDDEAAYTNAIHQRHYENLVVARSRLLL